MKKISGSEDIYAIMHEVFLRERKVTRSKEYFWIMGLAPDGKLLLIELISFGAATHKIAKPADVFSFALQKKVSQLIMVHSHMHKKLQVSLIHIQLTEYLAAIGTFLKVPVIDHLIITEKYYFSFADSGLLQKIKDETPYDLTFSKVDKAKEQASIDERLAKRKTGKRSVNTYHQPPKLKHK